MDKRKTNGGHSTKSNGVDKRKNPFRTAVTDAVTDEELKELIQVMYKKAVKEDDVQAAKIILEYCLGKPKQQIEQNNTHTVNDFNIKDLIKFDNTK